MLVGSRRHAKDDGYLIYYSLSYLSSQNRACLIHQEIQSPFPRGMPHRAVPVSVSIALDHVPADEVKATGGCSIGSSESLAFPLHSHISSARQECNEYHF